jgi:hypothetical protein
MCHVYRARRAGTVAAVALGVSLLAMPAVARANESRVVGGQGRESQWQPKESAALLTPEQVARIRRLAISTPKGRWLRQSAENRSAYWVAKSDEELRNLLPDSRVPRAANVSFEGCPIHGKAIYQHGKYPWKLDRERPYTIECPIGGERYPSNGYVPPGDAGVTETKGSGQYYDDGWGWMSPEGERYWFVAYACHWHWQKDWLPAVTALAEAYLLTGKPIYARKAIVMLDRIAEVYPDMDYGRQSRYGTLRDGKYPGKILNRMWETRTLGNLAIAYDRVFDDLTGRSAVMLPWRSADAIRRNIEEYLLEEGLRAIERGEIESTHEITSTAYLRAALVRGGGLEKKALDTILRGTQGASGHAGLSYALYNQTFKDGLSEQTSPYYMSFGFEWLMETGQLLRLMGVDLYERFRIRDMLDAYIDMTCAGEFTPCIGDAGSIESRWIGPDAWVYEDAYRRTGDPKYGWAMQKLAGSQGQRAASIEELLEGPLFANRQVESVVNTYWASHRPRSRVLDGYGLGILNNRDDAIAVSLFYGPWGSHSHSDRLNVELFGHGRRLSPDLGYPDRMTGFCPELFTWWKHTVSHNCMIVDGERQRGNVPGRVLRFHESPTVHLIDVEAPGTYEQTSVYRRTLLLVGVSEEDSYLVDVFRVRGGKRHVLSIHGGPGEFSLDGASDVPIVRKGTLAGANVEYGEIYDDPRLSKPGYKGIYNGYRGNGYQHFFNWQRVAGESTVTGRWRYREEPACELAVHVLPHPGQEVVAADAFVSPVRRETRLKYMLVERKASQGGNTFVTVWEPYRLRPLITGIELHEYGSLGEGSDGVVALTVDRGEGSDIIVLSPGDRRYLLGDQLRSDAAAVVVTVEKGRATRTFAAGGSELTAGVPQETIAIPPTLRGRIAEADYANRTVQVEPRGPVASPEELKDLTVRISNEYHSCVYRIKDAEEADGSLRLGLEGSDVFTGRICIDEVNGPQRAITTRTNLFEPMRLRGMYVVSEDLKHSFRIEAVDDGRFKLGPGDGLEVFAGRNRSEETALNAWIADFGVGDEVEIEQFVHSATGRAW